MKTELRLRPHTILPNINIVEIWHNGNFIGQITGADGPGIRIISKRELVVMHHHKGNGTAEQPDVLSISVVE